MGNKHVIESVLRPAVELNSAIVAFCAGAVCLYAPWSLALTPSIGYGMCGAFWLFSFLRFKQGWRILKFRQNIRRLPYYALTSKQIPISSRYLFLGKGFAWEQKHTQRLYTCTRSEVADYVKPSLLYQYARSLEKWSDQHLPKIAKLLRTDKWYNPVRPLPPVGGSPMIHGIELDEQDVLLPLGERVGHTIVLGTTRVGKTRLAEMLVTQDIHRGKTIDEREVVVFFDPKGDADMLKRMYVEAKRAGRENEFYVFHLGWPEISARYNAVGRFGRVSEVAGRISGQLSSEGNSAAFKEFAWRFVNIIARAQVELGRRPDYPSIARYVQNIDELFIDYATKFLGKTQPKTWEAIAAAASKINDKNTPRNMMGRDPIVIALEQYLTQAKIYDPVLDGLRSAVRYDKTYFDKIVASLLPLLEKLTTGKIAELLAPNYSDIHDERPIFDWQEIIRKRGIVYIGLDALSDTTVASAVGNSMFADLVSMAGHIYKYGINQGLPDTLQGKSQKVSINLHCDEFNELMGDEFIPLINKGGGAGIQVTAYTQTLSDIEARIGNKAKAGQVIGNFNNLIMLRVREPATAELLTNQLHEVDVLKNTTISGVTDSSNPYSDQHFTSNTQDRVSSEKVPMITPANVISLPKGQAFALLEGGKLWKIRMPLPVSDKDENMPASIEQLSEYMKKNYQTGEALWSRVAYEYTPSSEAIAAFEQVVSSGVINSLDIAADVANSINTEVIEQQEEVTHG
ncbi:type IV conjugative transfer system coupling protein TraD [Gallibacterium salpingitidis]|uniref:type IV conjugative transfer system coupling protein TraD n=1 Tax=Gallibacterium salpingitidis TaxID=505341 RepID=UPI00266EFF26|nr:type IV conjugative transfer system coupling protein TraD [Gallibacterium salpingitidis]WKS98613.1 type IV conjugative transfer system coupling protein TraD [Gallibacterium salpingitidis]